MPLIVKPKKEQVQGQLTQMQKMALQYLPLEQVTKFDGFDDLIEKELLNEAREPEIENTLRDLFDALHERNTPKLLKVMQGDKKKIFFAFKKQLEGKANLTKREAKILAMVSTQELSLLTISTIRE